MDEKARRSELELAQTAMRDQRFAEAGEHFLVAREPYDAALCFQKANALKKCFEALLKVPVLSANYRAACVHATRVAGMIGEPLTRVTALATSFLDTSPASQAEASAMKELAAPKAPAEAAAIYRRVLAAYPTDQESKDSLAALQPRERTAPPPRPSHPRGRTGKRFTELLVAKGRLTQARLMQVITLHKDLESNDLALGEALVADGMVSELDVVKALSEQTGVPYISCPRLLASATKETVKLLPRAKAEQWKVLPIALIDRHLWVAMRDPRDFRLLDQLRFVAGHPIDGVFATESALRKGLLKLYDGEEQLDLGAEDWRSWDQMPMVAVSRFSDRFTGTREHEFDTQEMISRAEEELSSQKKPAATPRSPAPLASPPAPTPLTSATRDMHITGSVIAGRYKLEQLLGEGGSATVHRAMDLELNEAVAIKLFAPSEKTESRLARYKVELSLSRQLTHPNIIRLFDLGMHQSWRYLTMELLEGSDLGSKLEKLKGPMPLVEGLIVLEQACAALQCAHDNEVIHRDVKPGNLFITRQGVVKLMDFGIAKKERLQHITAEGMVAGTPEYMSPEQISSFSTVTHLTDLYALGCTAYAAFSGSPPFTSPELMSVLMQQANSTPVPLRQKNPKVPAELDALVSRLLEKDPARRVQSCRQLGDDLKRIRAGL